MSTSSCIKLSTLYIMFMEHRKRDCCRIAYVLLTGNGEYLEVIVIDRTDPKYNYFYINSDNKTFYCISAFLLRKCEIPLNHVLKTCTLIP